MKFEVNGERSGRSTNAFELGPFVDPEKVILGDDVSCPVDRRKVPSVGRQCQLCASALDTAAFFADLGGGGEMNVQRQENNEQQCCNTDDASELIRFGGKRRQHVGEFSLVDLSMSTSEET